MLTKFFILAVAVIGMAAAGNWFSSSNFPKVYGAYYLVPVTAAPTTAAPATAAPTPTTNQQLTNNALIAAQIAAKTAGYGLRVNRINTACAPSSPGVRTYRGTLGGVTDQCVFCSCSETITATSTLASLANCRITGCVSSVATVQSTWTTATSAAAWTSLGAATDYQLYKVPTGYCFVEPLDSASNSRNMQCFEVNP